jgi:hypothetical protein
VLLALVSAPVLSTVLPPLVDYPNHLARMRLIAEGGNRFYAVHWTPLPNLAQDLIVPPLAQLIPLETAGRLFLVIIFALVACGVLCLNRAATGAWRVWPLAAFLLLYNRTFLWGFLNYLFGLGVALCGAALWLMLEKKRVWLRILSSSLAALAAFFSHLAAFGVYALIICGVELPRALSDLRARRWPSLARAAALFGVQFIVPAAFLVDWSRPTAHPAVDLAGFLRKFDLLFSVFDNYHRPFDIAGFALFAGLLLWLAAAGRLGLTPRLGCAVLSLLVAFLVLPARIFGGSGLDHRLPLAVFLLLVAGSAPRFPDRRTAVAVASAALMLLTTRVAVIESVWSRADRIYSADLAGIDALPPGVRLAVAYPADAIHVVAVPTVQLPAMAVVRRNGFVPTLFAFTGQQPLALRPPWIAVAAAAPPPLLLDALTGAASLPVLAQFDAVALVGERPSQVPANPCLPVVFAAPGLRIFAVRHGPGCAAVGGG